MARRPPNAPPEDGRTQRVLKLVFFIAIFGPMALFGLYHLGRAVDKMIRGEPVGYQQRDAPPGIRVDE